MGEGGFEPWIFPLKTLGGANSATRLLTTKNGFRILKADVFFSDIGTSTIFMSQWFGSENLGD